MTTKQKSDGEQRRDRIVAILGEHYDDEVSRAALYNIVKDEGWTQPQLDATLQGLRVSNVTYKGDIGYTLTTAPAGYNERLIAQRNAAGEQAPDAVKVSSLDAKPIDAVLRKPDPLNPTNFPKPPSAPVSEPVKISNAGYSGTSDKADPCDSCDNPKDCLCGDELDGGPIVRTPPTPPPANWPCPKCGEPVPIGSQCVEPCGKVEVKPAVLPDDFDPVVRTLPPVPIKPFDDDKTTISVVDTGRCPNCEGIVLNGTCLNEYCTYEAPAPKWPYDPSELPAGIDPLAVRAALGKLQARLTVDRVVIDKELKLEVLDYLGRILDDSIEVVLVSIAGDLTK